MPLKLTFKLSLSSGKRAFGVRPLMLTLLATYAEVKEMNITTKACKEST